MTFHHIWENAEWLAPAKLGAAPRGVGDAEGSTDPGRAASQDRPGSVPTIPTREALITGLVVGALLLCIGVAFAGLLA